MAAKNVDKQFSYRPAIIFTIILPYCITLKKNHFWLALQVASSNDKEVQGEDFVRKLCQETLEALAYLDYKGIVHTSLVRIISHCGSDLLETFETGPKFHMPENKSIQKLDFTCPVLENL